MKTDTLLDAIGMISDEYVQDAKSVYVVKKSHPWLKWSAMAACACFLVYLGLQSGFGGGFSQDCATNEGSSMNAGSAQSTGSNSATSGNTSTESNEMASDSWQESADGAGNQGSYPYNDKFVLDYVGMELEDMVTEEGAIVFNEITDIEMYRDLNYHPSGAYLYETHAGLYCYLNAQKDTGYFLMTVEDGLRSGNETYEWACAEYDSMENVTEYLLWEEGLGTSLYGAATEEAGAVALQTTPAEGPNGQITLLVSKNLDALGEEVHALVTPMREMLGTEQASTFNGQEMAVQYFYQQRMFREEAVEECYNYYVYFEKDDTQYLYQYSSNWTLPGESVTAIHNPPHTLSEALSQEESRELFADVLAGMLESLE